MEGKWRKLRNTAFVEEDKVKTFNGVFYIISLGKRQLLHINLVFNFDKNASRKIQILRRI